MTNVGIVIVSHSPKVAEGAADMVRQMVGDSVPLAWTGGNPDGGLGTDVAAIIAAIDRAWSEAGVAVLVDLGGAETNSEMAIDMLDIGPARQGRRVRRADRRRRGDGRHRSVRRRDARRGAAHRRGTVADMTTRRLTIPCRRPTPCTRGSALLTNDVGLHARPSVKLTQLAKRFGAHIEFARAADGPWVDAKSPVKVMRFKARQGRNAAFSRERRRCRRGARGGRRARRTGLR